VTADTTTPALTGRKRWVALLFLALGVAMIILDATVVNVAIPTMVKDLGLSTTDAEWVNAIYALLFASLLLLSGRLSDIIGRRLMFVGGVALFAVASVMVAMSDQAYELIGARALQGVAAAMILPASLSVLNAVYRGKDRAIAFAVWGATIGGMAALGPLVGGWLTTYHSWHWAFLINVPIAIAVIVGVLLLVPETRDTVDKRGIDVSGTVLGTLGLGALVFGLIEGQNYGWITPKKQFTAAGFTWPFDSISAPGVALLLAAILLALFVWAEARRKAVGAVVLVDLSLFRIRTFGAGNLVALIVSLGEFGLLFILPLFLQSVIGYDALETGVILLALAAGSFIASGAGAGMARRIGPVLVLRIGMALEVIGVLWIALVLSTSVTGWTMAPGLFVYGLGVGFATAQLTGVILSEVPVAESGMASAVQSTSRQVGAAIGTALLGAVLITGLGTITNDLPNAAFRSQQPSRSPRSCSRPPAPRSPACLRNPTGTCSSRAPPEGFATAAKQVGYVASFLIALGLLAAFFLPRNAARTEAAGYAE